MSNDEVRRGQGQHRSKIANGDRLTALGQAIDGRPVADAAGRPKLQSHRRRRRPWIGRSLLAVGVVAVVLLTGVGADYIYLGSLLHHKDVKHLQSSGATENILLIGSTTRCGLRVQNAAYGLCSQGVTGVNSDIDMIVHLDLSSGTVSLLSIPRDLFVPNARTTGANKIDAALYQGPSQLVAAIEEDFAIPINHYVELNFDTFANVVDALGGVRMYFPVPLFDQYSGLNIKQSGCYLLDGVHALRVVRSRHLQYQTNSSDTNVATWPHEALSDLARIRRTHEFLRVIAAKVAARGIGNPITDQNIATSVLPFLTVDSGFSESHMVSLAQTFSGTKISNIPQFTFPVIQVETGSYLYQGYYYGDVEFPVQPDALDVVHRLFGVAANANSFTYQPLPSPSSFSLSVENGTGIANQATSVARQLTRAGFKAAASGNVTPVGTVGETVVWYGGPPPPPAGNWKSPSQAAAQVVLQQLQGPAILGYDPSHVTAGALVTLQTGTGLTVESTTRPTSSRPTTTTPSATPTTSPGVTSSTVFDPPGIKSNNLFSAPSAVNSTLEPWDPRACNAAGTGPAVVAKPQSSG